MHAHVTLCGDGVVQCGQVDVEGGFGDELGVVLLGPIERDELRISVACRVFEVM